MNTSPFLLVTGSPRTGTTMLMNWLEKAMTVSKLWVRESGVPVLAHRLVGAIDLERRDHHWGFDLLKDQESRATALQHVRNLVRALYQSRGWKPEGWIVDKEPYFGPDGSLFTSHLRELFPDLKIICMLRRPEPVISSMLQRRWGRGPFPGPNRIAPFDLTSSALDNCISDQAPRGANDPVLPCSLPWSLEKCCVSYANAIDMCHSLMDLPHVLFLNYDAMHDRDGVKKQVASFLGLKLGVPYEWKSPTPSIPFTEAQQKTIEILLAERKTVQKLNELLRGATS